MSSRRESSDNRRRHSRPYKRENSDPSNDIECYERVREINRLKDRIDRLDDRLRARDIEHSEILQENTRLKALLAEKDLELNEEKRKSNGVNNYVFTVNKERQELGAQLAAAKAMAYEHQKQSEGKQKTIDYLKFRLEEDEKRYNKELLRYKENNDLLRKRITGNGADPSQEVLTLRASVKQLKGQLAANTRQPSGEYQKRCQTLEAENESLRNQLKNSNSEEVKLKRQIKYFQRTNELNKRKFIGTSVTAIKQKYLYFKSMRRLGRTSLASGQRLMNRIKEVVDEEYRLNRSAQIQEMATIVTDLGENGRQIEAAEERVVKKRPDDRVLCSECDKTFADTKDLIRHLTVTHKMNVNEKSKNPIPLITIDD